jgi:hypothetical protein
MHILALFFGVVVFIASVTALLDVVRFVWVYRPIIANEHPAGAARFRAALMPAYGIIPTLLGLGALWLIQWGWAR